MGLFKREQRNQSMTPTQPIMFIPNSNGYSFTTSGEQAVKSIPALASAVSTIANDMNAVDFIGTQAKALNKINLLSTYRALLIEGNAFLIIEKGSNGIVTDFKPVLNSDVTLNLDKGVVTYTINNNSGDEAYSSGIYSADSIVHLTINNGTGSTLERLLGHSPIEALENVLKQSQLSNNQIEAMLKNNINPKVLLQLATDLDEDGKQAIKKSFMQANQDSVWITGPSVKVEKMYKESDNSDLLNYTKQLSDGTNQVATAFSIPSSYVGATTQDDAQSNSDQIATRYIDSLVHNYLNPVLFELKAKLSSDIKLDLSPLDFDNSDYKKFVFDLVDKGIIDSDKALEMLQKKGLIDVE